MQFTNSRNSFYNRPPQATASRVIPQNSEKTIAQSLYICVRHTRAAVFYDQTGCGRYDPTHIDAGTQRLAIGNKALITPPGSGRFIAGWYQTQWGDLYVSKGIGTSVIPMRIGARPEVSIFEVK